MALGCLGVVTQVTLQCVPRHRLVEKVYTLTRQQVVDGHAVRLRTVKHLKYLWIPYTDCVAVVECIELPKDDITREVPERAARK